MNSSFAVKHANICKCISKWNEKFIFIPLALYIKIVLAKITAKFVSKMCIVTLISHIKVICLTDDVTSNSCTQNTYQWRGVANANTKF